MVATIEVTQPNQTIEKTSSYACHICGLIGHKRTNYPEFVKVYKMFHGKSMTIAKIQLVTETQIIITDVNVVDVNVTTRNKVIEKPIFE